MIQQINSFPNELILLLLGVASWCDLRSRRIPNQLILVGIFSGIFCSVFLSTALSLTDALLGFVLGIAILLPLYLLGAIGAGDVKLVGVVGLFLGAANLLNAIVFTAISGGLLALLYILKVLLSNMNNKNQRSVSFKTIQLPYAVAIFAGTFLAINDMQIIF